MQLSARFRERLREPFGLLIPDHDVTRVRVSDVIRAAKLVVTVGDATTERLVAFGIIPDIAVVDGIERRSQRAASIDYPASELRCSNPPGVITDEAIDALKRAIRNRHPSKVIVDGEEDLLALPLFYLVPEGSVVLYGQPLEGLVVVRITASKKKEARNLIRLAKKLSASTGAGTNSKGRGRGSSAKIRN